MALLHVEAVHEAVLAAARERRLGRRRMAMNANASVEG